MRSAMLSIGVLCTLMVLLSGSAVQASAQHLPLPALPYEYDGLEPFYSDAALKLHHLGHHQTYTDKLNAALFTLRERGGAAKELAKRGVDAILTRLDEVPEDLRTALRNNGGGYVNHDLYWRSLSPPALSVPRESATLDSLVARPGPSADSLLGQAIARDFGSFDAFKKQFSDMSLAVFGSGWVWLYVHVEPSASGASALGSLRLQATANQDNPRILDQNDRHVLLLTIDLWEHAYYVDYYNKRAKFVEAFWSVIDWQRAEQEYSKHAEAAAAKETGHEAKTEL